MTEDAELLRRYAADNDEAMFAEFVRRHVDFVYGCALRRVGGDAHFAEDVTQEVFAAAARTARSLSAHPVMTGWLFTTTRNVAAQRVRTERRRRQREKEALAMEQNERGDNRSTAWEELRPVIDEALDRLSSGDRQAVLLRYFEGKSFAEIGGRLRVAENTARMRVDRALDKLSALLAGRGVASTSAALALGLANQVTVAAPAGLAASATAAALGAASTTGATGVGLIFMSMTKAQLAVASVVLVAGTTGFITQARTETDLRRELAALSTAAQSNPVLAEENRRLREGADVVAARTAPGTTELAQLRAESAELREQIAALSAGTPVLVKRSAGAAPTFTGPVFDVAALDQPPKAISQVPPTYPRNLRFAGMVGEVLVEFIVDEQGQVHEARALKSSHPELSDAAIDSVRRWKFQAGRKADGPVAARMKVPIVFTIDADDENEGHAAKAEKTSIEPWF